MHRWHVQIALRKPHPHKSRFLAEPVQSYNIPCLSPESISVHSLCLSFANLADFSIIILRHSFVQRRRFVLSVVVSVRLNVFWGLKEVVLIFLVFALCLSACVRFIRLFSPILFSLSLFLSSSSFVQHSNTLTLNHHTNRLSMGLVIRGA